MGRKEVVVVVGGERGEGDGESEKQVDSGYDFAQDMKAFDWSEELF